MLKKSSIVALGLILLIAAVLLAEGESWPTVEELRKGRLRGSPTAAVWTGEQARPETPVPASPAAIYAVNTTADAGPGSLRQAIIDANTVTPGVHDVIQFNIAPAGGVKTIFPLTPLPWLTDPAGVTIDGLTQAGAGIGASPPATLNLKIELDGISFNGGAAPGFARGLVLQSDNDTVQGLIVNNFWESGICIQGGPINEYARNCLVRWNIVGMDSTGTVCKGNGRENGANLWAGICICNSPADEFTPAFASYNTIEENLSSCNYTEGITVVGPIQPGDVHNNFVLGNWVGTDINGTADRGNIHEGICLCEGTHHNLVRRNLSSGNDYDGIGLQGYPNVGHEPPVPPIQTHSNQIDSNTVGIDINGNPLPNTMAGITIGEYGPSQWGCADKNYMGPDNIVAENGGDGITVWEDAVNNTNADENTITRNSIYENSGLGIDLQNDGVTANDPADPDTGPNEEVNFPVITSAIYSAGTGTTIISGTLDIGGSENTATIEVFKARLDPSGYGEGETYEGSTTPAAGGTWNITLWTLLPGDSVTATTTDQSGNTSEFCATVDVVSPPWDCDNNPPPNKTAGGYETESNDNCATADYAACETAYCGDISPASDVDYWVITLPTDTCYCLHVRVFGHDTPGQYAENQGLDPNLTIYASDCTTQLYYNDDYNGTFPDAEGRDAQYDCTDPSNCYQPGTTLYIKIAQPNNTYGPYLLVINCDTCECPVADLDTCEYYKPAYVDYAPAGMPDFDQKQDAWTCPSTGAWSHCGPVALADCFWWFDSKFETSGTPPPAVADNYPLVQNYTGVAGVDDHDTSNVIPFVDSMAVYCNTNAGTSCGTSVFDLATGAQNWLDSVGLGSAYNITVVPIDAAFGFEYIREQVLLSQDVILLIGFWQEQTPGYCERRGGHFMTVAGVCTDPTDSALCFSDPFYDLNEGDPPGPPPHNADVHNDAQYVSGPHGTMHHDKYYVDSSLCTAAGQPFFLELRNYAANPLWVANFDGQNRFDTLVDPTPPNGNPVHAILEWAVVICPVEPPDTCEYYKQGYLDFCPNGMPDFDQKQDAWTSPVTGNWSWCGPVALADCIWWFDSKFEPSPIDPRPFYPGPGNPPLNDGYPLVQSYDPSGIWDDHDTNNVMPFIQALAPMCNTDVTVPGTRLSDLEIGFQNWIATAGLAGLYSTYVIHGPDFDELRDSILSCQDVILLLGFYELIDGGPDCQWLGGHYVTAAGVCTMDTAICISDPYFDGNEGEPPLGAHGSSVHNDASLVSGPHGTNHHDRYDLQLNIYTCPSPATWMFTNYPNNWVDVSVFENENPIDPMPPVTYFGGPIVVLLDAALIICPAEPPPPEPTLGKVKHCFDTSGYRPSMGSPVGTNWHELWPNYCEYWICSSWIDNGDGVLSYCDTIDFVHVPTGQKIWEHVELVMPTIMVTFDDAPFDSIYLDGLDPNPLCTNITNPIGTWWHEVYPNYCTIWRITGWVDNGDGYLNYCDTVTIETPGGIEVYTGHVSEGMETDIVTTPLPTPGDEYDHNIDGYLPNDGDPAGTMWHELWPTFCQTWTLDEWRDNGDGTLSFCDTIKFRNLVEPDSIIWKHIEEVTATIKANNGIDTFYFDYMCGNPYVEFIFDAIGTYWHEILPVFSQRWVCQGWSDNGNFYLDSCDYIDLMLIDGPDSGLVVVYHVDGWETDIISTYITVGPPSDSAIILDTVIYMKPDGRLPAGPDIKFFMRWVYSAGNPVKAFTNGFRIYSPDGATWQPIVLDTVSHGWPTRYDMLFYWTYYSVTGSGADTVGIHGASLFGTGIAPPFDTSVWWIETQVYPADTGKHLCVDSSFFPPDKQWLWAAPPGSFPPYWSGPHCFEIAACCNHDGIRGDVDYNMAVNIADLTYLVNYLFFQGPAPPCLEEGDVDGSGAINVADLTFLVDYLFFNGVAPAACP